jgi:RES domain-containing protein
VFVWRLTRAAHQALDGEGARLNGGRWNREGVPVVYASSTLALAALEYLVHVDPRDAPTDLVALKIEVPDDLPSGRVLASELPADWNRVPDHPACTDAGEAWIATGRSAMLRVPSAIVPEEDNLLIQPLHPDAAGMVVALVRRFAFDPRLLR